MIAMNLGLVARATLSRSPFLMGVRALSGLPRRFATRASLRPLLAWERAAVASATPIVLIAA
jgi:hypothetical protein